MTELTSLPVATLPPDDIARGRAPLGMRLVTLVVIIVPLLGVIAVPFSLWGWGFGWTDLGLLLGMYVLTALGITVGFHRLFVHRSFETYMWVKVIWAILGSMAVQGPMLKWVAMHRRHHQHSDTLHDPHSPHSHGGGILGLLWGFWHAHIGWFFDADPPGLDRYVEDLRASRALRVTSFLFPVWIVLGLVIPAVLGGVITLSWAGVWTGLIWGGLVRVFLVHHVTWSVNSACHLWGFRPYRSGDESRNNFVFGILAMGEGWHNTHHAFPTSARHGLRWWQADVSYWVIRALALVGLAWNVKLPTAEAQTRKQRDRQRTEDIEVKQGSEILAREHHDTPSSPPVLQHTLRSREGDISEQKCAMTPESFKHGPDQGAKERAPVLPLPETGSRPLGQSGTEGLPPRGSGLTGGQFPTWTPDGSRSLPAEPTQAYRAGRSGPCWFMR